MINHRYVALILLTFLVMGAVSSGATSAVLSDTEDVPVSVTINTSADDPSPDHSPCEKTRNESVTCDEDRLNQSRTDTSTESGSDDTAEGDGDGVTARDNATVVEPTPRANDSIAGGSDTESADDTPTVQSNVTAGSATTPPEGATPENPSQSGANTSDGDAASTTGSSQDGNATQTEDATRDGDGTETEDATRDGEAADSEDPTHDSDGTQTQDATGGSDSTDSHSNTTEG